MSGPILMLDPAVPGPLAAAQAALQRHDWQEAFERYNEAEADGGLSGPDLDALSTAAFFVGRVDIVLDAKERAFHRFQEAEDPIHAAAVGGEVERRAEPRSGRGRSGRGRHRGCREPRGRSHRDRKADRQP